MDKKEETYLLTFTNNMKEGVLYYQKMFSSITNTFEDIKQSVFKELEKSIDTLQNIGLEIEGLSPIAVAS